MRDKFARLLQVRRSVRKFGPKPVLEEDIQYILEAGKQAPTGVNRQPLEFVALKSEEIRNRYVDTVVKVLDRPQSPYYNASVIILVFGKPNSTYVLDGAAAVENMLLAATAIGLGACWIHASSEFFQTLEGREFMRSIGVEEGFEGLESIALGTLNGNFPEAKAKTEKTRII